MDQIPAEQLIAPAVVIDVRGKTAADPDYRLTAADVQAWEKKHGPVPQGAIAGGSGGPLRIVALVPAVKPAKP